MRPGAEAKDGADTDAAMLKKRIGCLKNRWVKCTHFLGALSVCVV